MLQNTPNTFEKPNSLRQYIYSLVRSDSLLPFFPPSLNRTAPSLTHSPTTLFGFSNTTMAPDSSRRKSLQFLVEVVLIFLLAVRAAKTAALENAGTYSPLGFLSMVIIFFLCSVA